MLFANKEVTLLILFLCLLEPIGRNWCCAAGILTFFLPDAWEAYAASCCPNPDFVLAPRRPWSEEETIDSSSAQEAWNVWSPPTVRAPETHFKMTPRFSLRHSDLGF